MGNGGVKMIENPVPCGYGQCNAKDKLVHFRTINGFRTWEIVDVAPGVKLPFHNRCFQEWFKSIQNKPKSRLRIGIDRGLPTIEFEREF